MAQYEMEFVEGAGGNCRAWSLWRGEESLQEAGGFAGNVGYQKAQQQLRALWDTVEGTMRAEGSAAS